MARPTLERPKIQHPFRWEKPSFLWNITNPSTIGSLVGAVAAAFPSKYLTVIGEISDILPGGELSSRLLFALLGFMVGYGSCKGCDWLRIRVLKSLLSYQGWVTNPKSMRTKLWGVLVSVLRGRKPYSTFEFQRLIPKQPLPTLDATLNKWLQVAENLLTRDDFETTTEVVEDFRKHEGPQIQKYLEKKARDTDSWIHDYWLKAAYLSSRQPLPITNNYYIIHASDTQHLDQLAKAATVTYWMARFEKLLSEEKLAPVVIRDIVPLCMHGFSYIFNSNRIPGEYMDEIVRYPGYTHVIVIRNGYYFKVDLYDTDDKGRKTQLTSHEIKLQYEKIMAEADKMEKFPQVAALTTQNRSTWAKQREELVKRNESLMKEIDTCMFVVSIDKTSPQDYADLAKISLTGDGSNRWFDKCYTFAALENGWSGSNVEHTALDAMVFTNLKEYVCVFEDYENKDVIKNGIPRQLPSPKGLSWDLTGMEENISKATVEYKAQIDDLTLIHHNPIYGKGFMKKQGFSPDGYLQMSLQLAFYRLHKFVPKTYEPSTNRLFLLGRTETVHPISEPSISWVKAMDDPMVDNKVKTDLLRKAVKIQTQSRLAATIGQGCDRHLVAMLCASRELGMDMPKIFAEKAWQMPFLLSTSQTPNYFYEYGCKMDLKAACGGFGPSDHDGYGLAYVIHNDDLINMNITNWKSSKISDGKQLAQQIDDALADMKQLFV